MGVAQQFSELTVEEQPPVADESAAATAATAAAPVPSSQDDAVSHRMAWERGDIDYTGRDSFDNIMQKISNTLAGNKQ